jgi:hypothetical protein
MGKGKECQDGEGKTHAGPGHDFAEEIAHITL